MDACMLTMEVPGLDLVQIQLEDDLVLLIPRHLPVQVVAHELLIRGMEAEPHGDSCIVVHGEAVTLPFAASVGHTLHTQSNRKSWGLLITLLSTGFLHLVKSIIQCLRVTDDEST